jgi:hypothetical protein
MRTKSYPSDLNRSQFAYVLPLLETARRKTKPRMSWFNNFGHPDKAKGKSLTQPKR